ncbi:NucA/NucB deoxyribonuclease domain-containing protein [Microbispora rosea]|uniref:NucA/NucB deoxyribonuclease domain-containing protein n=1 Tax=Microbispora rosea TaxID=58117 RepID=UPI00342CE760
MPKLGGTMFPESAGKSKDIPGKWNPDGDHVLHRLIDKDKKKDNYRNSCKTCQKEIASTWVSNIEKYPKTALNCDEFPFASTYEGSKPAKSAWNYSVKLINGVQNQTFGRKLKAWYQNNRILDNDKFGIWFKN